MSEDTKLLEMIPVNITSYTGIITEEMINNLKWHWGIDLEDNYLDKCTECRLCEEACTQKLPICDRLKFIRDEVEKYLVSEEAKKQQ